MSCAFGTPIATKSRCPSPLALSLSQKRHQALYHLWHWQCQGVGRFMSFHLRWICRVKRSNCWESSDVSMLCLARSQDNAAPRKGKELFGARAALKKMLRRSGMQMVLGKWSVMGISIFPCGSWLFCASDSSQWKSRFVADENQSLWNCSNHLKPVSIPISSTIIQQFSLKNNHLPKILFWRKVSNYMHLNPSTTHTLMPIF